MCFEFKDAHPGQQRPQKPSLPLHPLTDTGACGLNLTSFLQADLVTTLYKVPRFPKSRMSDDIPLSTSARLVDL